MKIGVQLFTVRKQAKKDLYGTLKDLRQTGIRYIEAARIEFNENTANIFKRASEDFETEVVSTQIKYGTLDGDFSNVLNFHKITGCKNAIISVLPTENIVGNNASLMQFCKKANILAIKYKDEGINLCYHHHDFEFIMRKEGIQFDILKEHLSEDVKFIIDTYWATKGGFAADKLIESLNSRVKGVHLRDYALVGAARKAKDFALGGGVINFKEVIETGKKYNVEYGAIEQKTKIPMQELRKSVEYLVEKGYKELL